MTPTNVRFTDDQLAFLANMDGDAKTPIGEKVRRLVDEGRQLREGMADYLAAASMTARLLEKPRQCLRAREHQLGRRSDILARSFESLPDAFAYLISSACETDDETNVPLARLELEMSDRLLSLVEVLLQQAATEFSSCYEPKLVRERLQPRLAALTRLAGLVNEP